MDKSKILPILIVTILSWTSLNALAQEHRYSVSGTVIDEITRQPVMGVYVTTAGKGAQTDRQGRFTIHNLPEGEHTLKTMYFSDYGVTDQLICLNANLSDITMYLKCGVPLDQVVVTGTRTLKRLADVPVLTTVVSSREIEKAGSTSLLESLQDNVPGIVFSQNEMGNNMRIRGLNSRYVLFLVDGERLVSEGADGNVNLDQIDVGNIQRIEIINGAASALYGSNAVGAVINVITKEPVHRFEAGANVAAESNNTWKTRIDAGSSTEKFKTRVSAFSNRSDGFGANGTGPYAARYEDTGGDLKIGYKPATRTDINLTARYFRHESFNPGNSMNVTHPLTRTIAAGINGGYTSADRRNTLRLSAHFDKYFDYDVMEKKSNETKKDNTAGYFSARAVDTYKYSDKWEFVGGAEFNLEEIYSVSTLGSNPATKDVNDMNGFVQAQFTPVEKFDILAGARYTHNSQFGGAFSPKLSLMYDLSGFKLRGGIGSAFRAPSVKELYYDFDHQGSFWVYGNPGLKAEKGIYSSLSAEYTKNLFNASVSAYYNEIDNKITRYDVITEEGRNEKHYKNVSSATLQGIDVNLSYTVLNQVSLRASYSFCDAVDNETGLQLESNTKHSGTVSATWNGSIARSPFSLQFGGRIHSPKLYQSVTTDAAGNEISTKTESKSYSIWKVVLVKPFRLNKHTFEVTGKVDNIFGFKDHSFINPGTQYMLGLRYRFK